MSHIQICLCNGTHRWNRLSRALSLSTVNLRRNRNKVATTLKNYNIYIHVQISGDRSLYLRLLVPFQQQLCVCVPNRIIHVALARTTRRLHIFTHCRCGPHCRHRSFSSFSDLLRSSSSPFLWLVPERTQRACLPVCLSASLPSGEGIHSVNLCRLHGSPHLPLPASSTALINNRLVNKNSAAAATSARRQLQRRRAIALCSQTRFGGGLSRTRHSLFCTAPGARERESWGEPMGEAGVAFGPGRPWSARRFVLVRLP